MLICNKLKPRIDYPFYSFTIVKFHAWTESYGDYKQFQTPAQYYIAYIRCVPIYPFILLNVIYLTSAIITLERYCKNNKVLWSIFFHFVKEFIFNNSLIALEIKYLHLYILDLSRAAVLKYYRAYRRGRRPTWVYRESAIPNSGIDEGDF